VYVSYQCGSIVKIYAVLAFFPHDGGYPNKEINLR